MSLTFRDAPSFGRETAAVTGGATAAGAVAAALGSGWGLPLVALAAGAAIFGGSVGAAWAKDARWPTRIVRALVGVAAGGAVAAICHIVGVHSHFGSSLPALATASMLGGLAVGSLITAGEKKTSLLARAAGICATGLTGAVGVMALDRVAAYAVSEGGGGLLTVTTMAGAFGLWLAAASGLRHIAPVRDPVQEKADAVLEGLAEPTRSKVKDCLQCQGEIEAALARASESATDVLAPETRSAARRQAGLLIDAVLETALTWRQIHSDLESPRLAGIDDKLADIERRMQQTTDAVTLGHLHRAAQALRSQQSAIEGLRTGESRAAAALDAQDALLERLRLAVAQHRVTDRERFAVEVSAIADQVARLTDDLDSLTAALAEAEALADRRVLADLEGAGRRALAQLDDLEPDGREEHQAALAAHPPSSRTR